MTVQASDTPVGGHINFLYGDQSCHTLYNDANSSTWDVDTLQTDSFNDGDQAWDSGCDPIYFNSHDARFHIGTIYEDAAASSVYHDASCAGCSNGNFNSIGTLKFAGGGPRWNMANDNSPLFRIDAPPVGGGSIGSIHVAQVVLSGATPNGSPTNAYENASAGGSFLINGLWIPFVPTFTFAGGGSVTTSTATASYLWDNSGRITTQVNMAVIGLSAPSNSAQITGRPVACAANGTDSGVGGTIPYSATGFTNLTGTMFLQDGLGSSAINLYQGDPMGLTTVQGSNFTSSSVITGMTSCKGPPA